jgi:predicted DNA-binding ribbon-helix-helix protein
MRKHSVSIQGHRTSVSLEDIFWDGLKRAAQEEQKPLAQLIADIDTAKGSGLTRLAVPTCIGQCAWLIRSALWQALQLAQR